MIARCPADDVEHLKNRHAAADELRESARKSRHANLVHKRSKDGELELPTIAQLLAPLGAQEGADAKNSSTDPQDEKIPSRANEIAHVKEELSWSRQLRAKILEDFTENRNHANK